MVLFGGSCSFGNQSEMVNDLYYYHFEEKRWEEIQVENKPRERRSHLGLLYNKALYIFGGYGKKTLSDMHFIPLTLRSWTFSSHKIFPEDFKNVIFCLLLIQNRKNVPFGFLPKQLVFFIIKMIVKTSCFL